MTKEEKQLLFKDLCARVPYGVKYCRESWNYEWDQEMSVVEVLEDIDKDGYINYYKVYKVDDIKPYLRSMSSMTEEEKEELKQEHIKDEKLYAECLTKAANGDNSMRGKVIPHFTADWCNKNHFDYRGLIEKGLALEAPEDMYKTK